ncbi:MAG: hypothetical protein A3I68_06620 [Candidatus Melainabacteria bacterium RIFCSPLOWO2_02_FULL_35_15]|nr:MAG: hypothetical protein A3F80_00140 [Candidatus Melainabacteria bacterium RIFCSPLOWO2_12_FULL_35_11]OGI13608.1 MAG: hypothetical protein A3I68_06620 [Candidatus Melainabacteria bacterium RIFCSPLOWO2_02_FULL_35_15]
MSSIIMILITLVQGYTFLMFVWVILSWIPDLKFSAFYRFLDRIFMPFLEPFRRIIPPINGIDISPILGFFVLQVITTLLGRLL